MVTDFSPVERSTSPEEFMLKPLVAISALLLFGYAVKLPPAAQTQTAPVPSFAIPPEAARMTNPIKPTQVSQAHAKKMYGYDCAMCHGETGNGKGELAAEMKLTMADLSDPEAMKAVTDGEMFYVIQNGKDKMPGEGDRGKPEDVWNMVVYVRSLAKK
jgi:mono/diheme cytochrome c family protein